MASAAVLRGALLRGVVEAARAALDARASSIALVDPRTGDLVFEAVAGGGGRSCSARISAPTRASPATSCRRARRSMIDDLAREPRFAHDIAVETGYTPEALYASPRSRSAGPSSACCRCSTPAAAAGRRRGRARGAVHARRRRARAQRRARRRPRLTGRGRPGPLASATLGRRRRLPHDPAPSPAIGGSDRFVPLTDMAKEPIPTSRLRRSATVGRLAAEQAARQLGTRAANLTRDEQRAAGGARPPAGRDRRADRRRAGDDEGRRDEARPGHVVPRRRPRPARVPRAVPGQARRAARRRAEGRLQGHEEGHRAGVRREDRGRLRDASTRSRSPRRRSARSTARASRTGATSR